MCGKKCKRRVARDFRAILEENENEKARKELRRDLFTDLNFWNRLTRIQPWNHGWFWLFIGVAGSLSVIILIFLVVVVTQ